MRRRSAATRSTYLQKALGAELVLSVVLGAVLETLLAVAAISQSLVAGFLQNAVRAAVICGGLVLGSAALSRRAQAMGLGGLLAGPLGIYAGRFMRDAVARLLDLPDAALGTGIEPATLAILKGLEYGCLGVAIGLLGLWGRSRPVLYAVAGGAVGLIFGGLILALSPRTQLSATTLTTWGINELLFPIGCALVVYFAEARGRMLAQ